jgi:steroid 5-alpha reductase family enzyme
MLSADPSAVPVLAPILWGLGGSAALMAALYGLARAQRNANWVDVGWAASLAGLSIGFAATGPGAVAQRLLIGVLAGSWSLRLTVHLLFDRGLGVPEDGRYRHLRAHWGERADLHFAWFFQAQALLAVLLALPFLLVASHADPAIAPVQWAGAGLFAVAVGGETLADRQLARWRRDPANRGRTCRAGLWRYSRHPNYFCEWLVWVSFALVATPAPHGAFAWLAPALIYVLVTRLTGIPYTELQALRSRGDDYRRYQATTNAFFPWFPRDGAPSTDRPEGAH